jgi:hypothetical protein
MGAFYELSVNINTPAQNAIVTGRFTVTGTAKAFLPGSVGILACGQRRKAR